jgi:hypothetical protein
MKNEGEKQRMKASVVEEEVGRRMMAKNFPLEGCEAR